MIFNDSVALPMSGSFCGHTGPYLLASRTPLQCDGVTGGINLNVLIGGEAYGTPKNASTGDREAGDGRCDDVPGVEDEESRDRGIITPRRVPYFVFTWRGLGVTSGCPSYAINTCNEEVMMTITWEITVK